MFLIAGTKGRPKAVGSGRFYCPKESGDRAYKRIVMKRAATVFFVPVANIGDLGEYIECQSCGGTYTVEVLDLMRESQAMDTFSRGMQRLAAAMIAADGRVTRDERDAVIDLLNDKFEIPYSHDDLEEDLELGEDDLQEILEDAGSVMNLAGRENMIRAALYLSAIDDDLSDDEMDLLFDAGSDLGLSKAHVKGIISDALGR